MLKNVGYAGWNFLVSVCEGWGGGGGFVSAEKESRLFLLFLFLFLRVTGHLQLTVYKLVTC